eukprot:COSAG06_NODE_681_length_13133_cov_6.625547_17_plen_99_part_00
MHGSRNLPMHRRAILSGSETLSQSALCASITPRYQTATFLAGYGPGGRTRVWAAANHTATGKVAVRYDHPLFSPGVYTVLLAKMRSMPVTFRRQSRRR